MRLNLRNYLTVLFLAVPCIFITFDDVVAKSEAELLYSSGLILFEAKKYNEAIEELEKAVKLAPENASYQHILAVSYGREAEQANWFRAMDLAKKTLKHLELASKLDPDNVEILDDLMDYYREAPGFLGGDSEKADKIEDLIKKISLKELESPKID